VYHLDYQEELWADETEKSEQKKTSKKSKSKKKKEKAKQKKAKQDLNPVTFADGVKDGKNSAPSASKSGGAEQSRSSTVSSGSDDKDLKSTDHGKDVASKESDLDNDDYKQNQQPAIDFVLYLQQTGSIIALAKLMDALEYGEDLDEGLDDSELQLIREQQLRNQQQATTR
jgi:hypothetical protein